MFRKKYPNVVRTELAGTVLVWILPARSLKNTTIDLSELALMFVVNPTTSFMHFFAQDAK